MIKILPLIVGLLLFFIFKLQNLEIRLSDANIYFHIGSELLKGNLLYRDIFFSNFPLFAYLSAFYVFITSGNLKLFFLTPIIEVLLTTIFIYIIVRKKTDNQLISLTSSLLYLFSFLILSTSDHQTGVFMASFLSVISLFFWQNKRLFLSGVFMALCLLTKAYFAPALLAFISYFILKRKWKRLFYFSMGFSFAFFLLLLPFLTQAYKQFIDAIFGFSLTRPTGASKINVVWFFISKDILFFILLVFNLLYIKSRPFFGFFSLWAFIFLFGYQDIYYLYLNSFAPFLAISFYSLVYFFKKQFQPLILYSIVFLLILFNFIIYFSSYRNLQKIENFEELLQTIKTEKPSRLYGINDITPALISLANIPPVDNIPDAHEYFFTKGKYNKTTVTKNAIKQKSILISHGAWYPQLGIEQDIVDGIFDKEVVNKNCSRLKSFPVQTEGIANHIVLFKCY